ncbi:hypothetical protein Syun_017107 [Stephania yunnanensis]|uniref:Uncharacterized protein n=1 Tax=Stephania yunnanensis TaxID=152371 RepID=A0AAP0J7W8_9MAGN
MFLTLPSIFRAKAVDVSDHTITLEPRFSIAKPNEDVDNFNDLIDNENESKLFTPSNARAMALDYGGPSTFVQEDSSSSTKTTKVYQMNHAK